MLSDADFRRRQQISPIYFETRAVMKHNTLLPLLKIRIRLIPDAAAAINLTSMLSTYDAAACYHR